MTATSAVSVSGMSGLKGRRRKGIQLGQELVQFKPLFDADDYLLLATPTTKGIDFLAWAKQYRSLIEEKLLRHGAILFRGFGVQEPAHFERCIEAISGASLEYKFRASPRTQIAGNIFTSTDYPADQPIFPHNEHAYSPVFPLRLYFCCHTPPGVRGETPLGDNRKILRDIDPEVVAKFKAKKILYVRNYGDGFGLPWRTVFQTDDPSEVDAYCRSIGIETEWKANDRLRTKQVGPAIMKHPRTGEDLWFNHGTFFHVTTLTPVISGQLQQQFAEEDLPTNTYYGDGSSIEPEVLEHLRDVYRRNMVMFPWQQGDFVLLDNMLSVHARSPYGGKRKVLTGMAEAYEASALQA